MTMRAIMFAAFAALAACTAAAPAADAQAGDPYAGTWAFQSQPYGNEQFGVIMSGAMVATHASGDAYTVRLTANEMIIARADGQTRLLTAHQTCTGARSGEVLNITCEIADAPEGYAADNFVLQRGEGEQDGQLVGAMAGNGVQVTFTRVR
jgi:hypothetical protein